MVTVAHMELDPLAVLSSASEAGLSSQVCSDCAARALGKEEPGFEIPDPLPLFCLSVLAPEGLALNSTIAEPRRLTWRGWWMHWCQNLSAAVASISCSGACGGAFEGVLTDGV